jgi:hypothetical protein
MVGLAKSGVGVGLAQEVRGSGWGHGGRRGRVPVGAKGSSGGVWVGEKQGG